MTSSETTSLLAAAAATEQRTGVGDGTSEGDVHRSSIVQFPVLGLGDVENHRHHYEAEVSPLELFSDLAVVVAIRVVSDTLTENLEHYYETSSTSYEEQEITSLYELWLWFFIRVYFLYMMWHNCMQLTNLCNVYTNNKMELRHYLSVFGTMIVLVLFIKSIQNDNDRISIISYVSAIFIQKSLYLAEAISPRPVWVDPDRYNNFHRVAKLSLAVLFPLENVVLIIMLIFIPDQEATHFFIWGGLWACLFHILGRTYIAHKFDEHPEYNHGARTLMDTEHLMERSGLITLILLGELCFAAAENPGDYYVSISAIITSMGTFLNYFVARVDGSVWPWERSAMWSVQGQHLHIALFCVIPSLSVAFVQIIEIVDTSHYVEAQRTEVPVAMGAASCSLLVVLGLMEALIADPELETLKPQRLKRERVSVDFFAGAVLMVAPFLLSATFLTYLVPSITLAVGFYQVWATRLVNKL